MPYKRTYKKRTYKKRTYKARRYKRRYYKRRYYRKPIKKPEIHILKEEYDYSSDDGDYTNGQFINLTPISAVVNSTQSDNMDFKIGDKQIEGRKIRLKYLYIKGYYQLSYSYQGSGEDDNTNDNNVNAKLYVFRVKRNTTNSNINSWATFLDMPIGQNNPSSWSQMDIQNVLYAYDWKNDIKTNIYKRVKNLYKSYDNTNNVIPFKIRIPLYDCVLTCENQYSVGNNNWVPNPNPSTNQILFNFVTLGSLTSKTAQQRAQFLHLKTKLYYTDY